MYNHYNKTQWPLIFSNKNLFLSFHYQTKIRTTNLTSLQMSHLINSLSLTKIVKHTWVLEREGTSCYMFSGPTFLLFFSSPSVSFLLTKQTGQTISFLSPTIFFLLLPVSSSSFSFSPSKGSINDLHLFIKIRASSSLSYHINTRRNRPHA